MITLNIQVKEVLFDVRNKSHNEVAGIADAEARYLVEAGMDKQDEIERCLTTSASLMMAVMGRFVMSHNTNLSSNRSGLPEYYYVNLDLSARRAEGKQQILADLAHSYLVNMTLSLFYKSVAQATLSEGREKMAIENAAQIEQLLFTKHKPFIHMTPIIRINTQEDPKKERKITLHKDLIYQEVDSYTSKFVDAQAPGTTQQQDALASDSEETLDGTIVTRLMEYRDSQLRTFLGASLKEEVVTSVDNVMNTEETTLEYDLLLDMDFRDSGLKALAMLLNKYIVWGVLFDWYNQHGSAQAKNCEVQLQELERQIHSAIHPAGYATRPLQPFDWNVPRGSRY